MHALRLIEGGAGQEPPAAAKLPVLNEDLETDGPPLPPLPNPLADDVAAWALGTDEQRLKRQKTKRFTAPKKSRERWREEMEAINAARAWERATPVHFVALYAKAHLKVYGVEATDLDGEGYAAAARAASSLFGRLNRNAKAMAEYIVWSWVEEKRKEEWRRAQGKPGRRLSWYLQFGQNSPLYAEWSIARARRRR